VARGIDMFDCVMPTRHARNGHSLRPGGASISQRRLPARTGRSIRLHLLDLSALFAAYLRHLDHCNEILGVRLSTLHNLHFYLRLMQEIRTRSRGDASRPCGAGTGNARRLAVPVA